MNCGLPPKLQTFMAVADTNMHDRSERSLKPQKAKEPERFNQPGQLMVTQQEIYVSAHAVGNDFQT
ncbi:hypothetical protein N7466_003633 [Penicillium verhagenii]|uniref:uncharacterized protein n=1 Tax=Penicillium verhagenii TaxID=1562060 RepID=UPI0025455A16|nr:uncharacterized protein N7466_003633 [Penicillium verhagenii]KAJ5934086.1 hypothetical protein N7466_003633 [Penicillium verhagenii]